MNSKMQNTEDYALEQWKFSFGEGGLSPTPFIESIAQQCKLFRPPTIIFGNNYAEIKDQKHGITLLYNAKEALKYINYQVRNTFYYSADKPVKVDGISYLPKKLQIKYAQKWKNLDMPKQIQITEVQESSDSFFVTPFKGKLIGDYEIQRASENVIPIHKLGQQNAIQFFKQGSIYQDQLDDNGLIQYQYKFRSMAESWFGLIRCYVRVDDVIVQILDTRIYWQKGWQKIARQFMVKESTWENLKNKGFATVGGWTTNPNQSHIVYEYLDEIFVENEYIQFKKPTS